MAIDYSLYLVTDRRFLKGRNLKKVVEDSILGGVTMVQVREKNVSTREFFNIAKEVQEVTDYYKIPLIINDRIDIAQALDTTGVHLGQSDMELSIARKILGKNKIIGISAGSIKEAIDAQNGGADYLGIGAIFPTGSKKNVSSILRLDGLKKIQNNVTIPSVAIGGINKSNFKDVLSTGVNGISVISAILGEDDIKTASKNLLLK